MSWLIKSGRDPKPPKPPKEKRKRCSSCGAVFGYYDTGKGFFNHNETCPHCGREYTVKKGTSGVNGWDDIDDGD